MLNKLLLSPSLKRLLSRKANLNKSDRRSRNKMMQQPSQKLQVM